MTEIEQKLQENETKATKDLKTKQDKEESKSEESKSEEGMSKTKRKNNNNNRRRQNKKQKNKQKAKEGEKAKNKEEENENKAKSDKQEEKENEEKTEATKEQTKEQTKEEKEDREYSETLLEHYLKELAENAQVEQTYAAPTSATTPTPGGYIGKSYRPPSDTLIDRTKTPKSRLSQKFEELTPNHAQKYSITFDENDRATTDETILKMIEVKNLDTGNVTSLYDASQDTSPQTPMSPMKPMELKETKETNTKETKEKKKTNEPEIDEETRNRFKNGAKKITKDAKAVLWMDDNMVNACIGCTRKFTFFFRRHHCRNCGRIFCNRCSRFRVPLPGFHYEQRVCQNCHTLHCASLIEE